MPRSDWSTPLTNSTDSKIQQHLRQANLQEREQNMKQAYFQRITLSEQPSSLNHWLLASSETLYNPALQTVVQPFSLANLPLISQGTRTTTVVEGSIMPISQGGLLLFNQESCATIQDSSPGQMLPVKTVTQSTENIWTRLIDALFKSPEWSLDCAFVLRRIGLEFKFQTQLKL